MLVITEHYILERTDDPRIYYNVAGAGLRLDSIRLFGVAEDVQVATVAEQAPFVAVAEHVQVATVAEQAPFVAVAEHVQVATVAEQATFVAVAELALVATVTD